MKIAHSWRIAAPLLLLVLPLMVAVSACAGRGNASSNPAAAESDSLRLGIALPADNAQVTSPFKVQLDSGVPLGAPETGEHHVHPYYDTPTPTGDYDLVYGNTAEVTALSPGTHTILASLRNANHSDAGPRAMITVTVGSGGVVQGADLSGAQGAPQDNNYGY